MSDSNSGSMPTKTIPAIVLGGTGYVSGELLRLILGHPGFTLAGVMSDSSPGEPAGKSFPHLAGALPASLLPRCSAPRRMAPPLRSSTTC
jgi:N-acetyl-gamma-glutamylphosphate reductase